MMPVEEIPATPIVGVSSNNNNVELEKENVYSPEQVSNQINEFFTKLQNNFDHNCRTFRTRSAQVMQKVEELETTLGEMIKSLQEEGDFVNDIKGNGSGDYDAMVSMVMADEEALLKTPSK